MDGRAASQVNWRGMPWPLMMQPWRSRRAKADLRTKKMFCQLRMCSANLDTSWAQLVSALEDAADNEVYAQPYSMEVLPHIARFFSTFPVVRDGGLSAGTSCWMAHAWWRSGGTAMSMCT